MAFYRPHYFNVSVVKFIITLLFSGPVCFGADGTGLQFTGDLNNDGKVDFIESGDSFGNAGGRFTVAISQKDGSMNIASIGFHPGAIAYYKGDLNELDKPKIRGYWQNYAHSVDFFYLDLATLKESGRIEIFTGLGIGLDIYKSVFDKSSLIRFKTVPTVELKHYDDDMK